jgi:hypothetical protein
MMDTEFCLPREVQWSKYIQIYLHILKYDMSLDSSVCIVTKLRAV